VDKQKHTEIEIETENMNVHKQTK